jgi:hypothetical protein
MPVPDPAERRTVIRGAIECAIGLCTATRTGQVGPLTAAVWRIVEPALTQRDHQVTAVRALHHEWTDTAPGRCAHCQDGQGTPLPWPCPTIRALDVKNLPTAADQEYDALKASYLEAVTSGAHRITVLEPDPVVEAHAVVQSVTRAQLHDAIRTLARIDQPWWDGELRRMARLEGRTSFLGGRR